MLRRNRLRRGAQILRPRKGNVSRKGNQEAPGERPAGRLRRAAEAVQDAAEARAGPLVAENLQAIVPGFAAVDDDRELPGAGALELPAEDRLLDVARGGVGVV